MRYDIGALRSSISRRFLDHFNKSENGCWIWRATVDKRGYGKFSVFGKPRAAHQVSWVLYRGYLPEGQFVLHSCDTPACVNPEHLFLGTHTDNMKDMHRKGRGDNRRGPNSARTTFSEADVLDIYRRCWAGERPIDLAKEFGVRPTTISCIKHGDNWAYLTGHIRQTHDTEVAA